MASEMDQMLLDECKAGHVVTLKLINNGYSASADRRAQGADFIHEAMRLGFEAGRTTVSFREAQGQRVVNESGSGRTRAETNAPHETGAGGGSQ